jgi:hypothetical protein
VRDDDLGDVHSEHRGRRGELFGVAALLVLVGALGAIAAREPSVIGIGIVGALVWLLLGARSTPRRALLRDRGLDVHWYLRRTTHFRFDDCREVLRDFSLRTTMFGTGVTDYALVLVDNAGRRLRLRPRSFEDADHLFTRIERVVVHPRERERREAFDRGEDVTFGAHLVVSDEAIRVAGEWSEWSDVREVELSPALLIIRFHGGRLRRVLRVSQIPFVWALLAILRKKGVRPKLFEGFREP